MPSCYETGVKDYIRYRMERSRQSLTVARYAFEQGHLQDAVNRLYYACFYLNSLNCIWIKCN